MVVLQSVLDHDDGLVCFWEFQKLCCLSHLNKNKKTNCVIVFPGPHWMWKAVHLILASQTQ